MFVFTQSNSADENMLLAHRRDGDGGSPPSTPVSTRRRQRNTAPAVAGLGHTVRPTTGTSA